MKHNEARRRIKVGLFLVAGAALVVTMLIMIGGSQHPFARKAYLHTAFRDTSGLTIGVPVYLGGVEVGAVQKIQFEPTLGIKEVSVTLAVQVRYLERIRGDSRATLIPHGLLGDYTVAITVGSPMAAPLADGDLLPSADTQTMTEMLSSLNGGIDEVRALSRRLRDHLDELVTPEVAGNVGRLVHAAADAADAIEHGNGLVNALLHDRELSAAARGIARSASRSAGDLASAMARIDRIAAAVEAGDGTLHRLISRDDAGPIVADAQRAAHELAEAATAIRSSPGPLHTLVYGPDGSELIGNLTALSRTLKKVGDDVAAGKGTVGALLEDPTIYQDLKVILGGVKRNTLLKALVRFTIQRDGLNQEGGATPPGSGRSASTARGAP
jgi:phospholipid/cholesterol/gamma-HCH transport system substrate-binding protein